MEQQRRTFLEGAGATVFALTPVVWGTRRQEDRIVKRGVYRSVEEEPLSEFEIENIQREAVRKYREQFGSDEPVGVGRIKPVLDFPVYKFQYMIESGGESQFWFTGPDTNRILETTTTEVEETPTEVEETPTEVEATPTPVEETPTTEGLETVKTTFEDTEPDTNIASRVESIGGYMQDIQTSTEGSLPTDAELDLTKPDEFVETTTEIRPTATTESLAESTTSSPRALGLGSTQESLTVDLPVARGIFTIETKAGTLHSVSKLGLDRSVAERAAHLIVQIIQLIPKPERGWEIQSLETVHDWRTARSDVVQQEHVPRGRAHGPKHSVSVDLGFSEASASWSYTQPDITRNDLTEAVPIPKWRWRWNRSDPGRNPVTLIVGSVVKHKERVAKGDRVGIVRLGATFRQRGTPPVGQCKRPWRRCVKPRFALESRYE